MPGVPFLGPMMAKMFGTRNERLVKRYTQRVDQIGALEPEMRSLTDSELRARTNDLRQRVKDGASEDDVLVDAFAVAREVMDRSVGIRNIFDPELNFDPSVLSETGQRLYTETKAVIAETPDADPIDDLRGNVEPVPSWKLVDIPVGLYDAVREVYSESKPPYRARPFDVQLIGGMVLSEHKLDRLRSASVGRNVYFGNIAEMKTGEGKTIVAPLACYLHGLCGRQIHVVTVNTYLVKRDRDWTFPFFYHVGMTVGHIAPMHELPEQLKKVAYTCDIVYGTTSEFGFDYLRDNMKMRTEDQVQKQRVFAIVDEVDSTLIDEARTPLIISGPAHDEAPRYALADKLAAHLVEMQKPWAEVDRKVEQCQMRIKGLEGDIRNARDKARIPEMKAELEKLNAELPQLEDARDRHVKYYEVEMDKKSVHLEHEGVTEAQKIADIGSFYVGDNIDMPHLLEQALRGRVVYERDKDYVVKNGEVVIVDQFTGRLMVGRQWSDGLHQAVEAKEGVEIKPETQTMATITIQNFFKLYERLAGMTGTADTEAQEFHDIYNMNVVVIPTNKPVVRGDFQDRVYLSQKDKWNAIVEEIKDFHDLGRPVLVGTTSVESSETLSQRLLKRFGIQHEVLNAKQHEREANMIENAGSLGAVMIATNMAGRGTDIKLRKISREDLIDHWKRRQIAPRDVDPNMSDEEILERVHRHLAEKTLGLKRAELDGMNISDVQRKLLEKWTEEYTYVAPKKIAGMSEEDMRTALDEGGNFLLHRLAIWSNTEEVGGLHVIGTERHESRRIDNQLRGRSGRQGDNGSSRFFISLEDDLMQMFAGEATLRILSRLGMKEGDAIEAPMLTKAVERAQRKVEERNFEVRKNILEYDEVMDHQRGSFYGRRQEILESIDLSDIVLEYVGDAVNDACNRFLADEFVPTCIAEWVQSNIDVSIEADRLRNLDFEDVVERIRKDAIDDARASIEVTLGEFMNDDADSEDWDLRGLVHWARTKYNVVFKTSEISEMSSRQIIEVLGDAAVEQIMAADLSPITEYLADDYGLNELLGWIDAKLMLKIDHEQIRELEIDEVADYIMDEVKRRYAEREIAYSVDYAMEMTLSIMTQDPMAALQNLCNFANTKYGVNWEPTALLTKTPQEQRRELIEAARGWNAERIEREVESGWVASNRNRDEFDNWLFERWRIRLLPADLELESDDELKASVGRRVRQYMRFELTQLERFVLLQVLDQAWKDHLYMMDQLRGSISFRGFAQQDPKIEYRREGRRMFDAMQEGVGDKVADIILKARLAPNHTPRSAFAGGRAQTRPRQDTGVRSGAAAPAAPGAGAAAAAAAAGGGGVATAEADDALASASAQKQADLAAANRAGTGNPDAAGASGPSKSDARAAKLRQARQDKAKKKRK